MEMTEVCCPLCVCDHTDDSSSEVSVVRLPLGGEVRDEVWFVCENHKVRWPEGGYWRSSWTPELVNDDERSPQEKGLTVAQVFERRMALREQYQEIEPPEVRTPERYLIEVPDKFAVARWPPDADVATIARCILGTLKYEPHAADITALRRALEGLTK
jgi:hypothetical protein